MAIILLVLSLAGCQTHPLESTPLDQVVVEAYLYENQPVDQIRLSHPFSISSPQGQNSPITEAQVFLSRNGMEYQLLPYPGEPGRYHAEDPALVVSSGDLFELKILYKEKIISAQTRVPSVPRIARISSQRPTRAATSVTTMTRGVSGQFHSIAYGTIQPLSRLPGRPSRPTRRAGSLPSCPPPALPWSAAPPVASAR
ncbi:MAG TPA: DUF4249 family protein, partial [Calditrichia bacterium]|nr:DUF4249 family protein [Calditrichia bacterium]